MFRKCVFLSVIIVMILSLSACEPSLETAGPSETGEGPVYNQAFISDQDFEHYDSMSLDEIQAFLAEWNSCLQGQIEDVDGQTFEPAQIIYEAAQTHCISPKVLLVTMEKEQRAITSTQLAQNHLALLTGAGSPSTARHQILYAAQLFRSYLNDLDTKGTTISGWKVGAPKLTEDGVQVTPINRAVAALFTYTPYAGVQWGGNQPQWGGNYLFYDAWYNKFRFGEVSPPPTPVEESEGIKITANKLEEEYKTNEIAADYKYKGRILTIVSRITDISRDPSENKAYVSIEDGRVRCFFNNENELLGLAKGEEVIVKGECLGKKEDEEGTSFPILFKDCSLIDETKFQLIDWKVLQGTHPNNVFIEISYKKFGRSVTLTLTNPKGEETSMQGIVLYWTEGKVYLRMTERDMGHPDFYYKNFQTPLGGDYQLLVKDSNERILATETFSFSGAVPKIEVTGYEGAWSWRPASKYRRHPVKGGYVPPYDLYRIFFKAKNTGDLPFCICGIAKVEDVHGYLGRGTLQCYLVDENGDRLLYSKGGLPILLPGEEKDVYASCISGVYICESPGVHQITLYFFDGGFELIYSTTIDITVPEMPPVE